MAADAGALSAPDYPVLRHQAGDDPSPNVLTEDSYVGAGGDLLQMAVIPITPPAAARPTLPLPIDVFLNFRAGAMEAVERALATPEGRTEVIFGAREYLTYIEANGAQIDEDDIYYAGRKLGGLIEIWLDKDPQISSFVRAQSIDPNQALVLRVFRRGLEDGLAASLAERR